MKKVRLHFWISLLTFFLIQSTASFAQNPFVPISLSNGISFNLPRNWIIFDQNLKTTLEAHVAALTPVPIDSELPFAANLYGSSQKTIGMINIRLYPNLDVYQVDVTKLDKNSINYFDEQLQQGISKGVNLSGNEVTNWYGTKRIEINKKNYLLSKYRRSSKISPGRYFKVRLVRLIDGAKSFTMTLSYEEGNEFLLRPIIEKIQKSVRSP